MGELLPCPFCGSKASYIKHESESGVGVYVKCNNKDCGTIGKLFSKYNYSGFGALYKFNELASKQKARDRWNKRHRVNNE